MAQSHRTEREPGEELICLSRTRLEALGRLARELVGELDLERLASVVLTEVTKVWGVDNIIMWLADEERRELRLLSHRGLAEEAAARLRTVPLDAPLLSASAARTGKLTALRNASEAGPEFALSREMAGSARWTSLLAVPLRSGPRSLGVLTFYWRDEHPFGDAERQLASALADLVSAAVQNAFQLNEVATLVRGMTESMASIAAPVTTSTDEVLRRIALAAQKLTGAQYVALGIGTDPTVSFHPWVYVGVTEEEAAAIGRTPRPVCLLGAVPHGGETIRLRDIGLDPRFCGFPAGHSVMRSFLGVPLKLGERSIGNLYMTNKVGAEEFSEEDQRVAEALAQHAAVAIESSRLFEAERERRAALEEQSERRETFISVVAHELRGPLTGLLGRAQMMQRTKSFTQERREHMAEAIGGDVRRLDRLVSDLLDFSRIESGRFDVRREPSDLVAVAHTVVEELCHVSGMHAIHFDSPPQLEANLDADRVAQALRNLLSNAIKYSPDGGNVWVRISREDGEAHISVADEGVGMAPEQLAQLFQPYSRLYRQRHVRGIGLGLYITKGIVEAHGGRTWVESTPGAGSTFHIALPIGLPAARAMRASP